MRLPAEFRTRTGYAVALTLSAILPGFLLSILVGGASGGLMVLSMMAWVILVPAILAWTLWPNSRRSGWKMAGVGFVITGISIAGGGALAGLMITLLDSRSQNFLELLSEMVDFAAIGLLFGTLFTLGIPWLLGIGVSVLFRNAPVASE